MPFGNGTGPLFGMHGYGWFFQLLILVLLFLIFYWIIKGDKTKETAMDIVRKRYARGDITEKEFSKLKRELR